MKLGKTLYVADGKAWRSWLARNHSKEKEIWLIYYRKSSGKERISYNDAVDEALCFGWIDSTIKNIDYEKFAQRFSLRRPTSGLSQANKERIRKLIAQKKMTKAGLAAVAHAFKSDEKFIIPKSILNAIKKDQAAWKNFQRLPESYKRIRIGYIKERRRHGTNALRKSLENFIRMTAKGKRFGFIQQ